MSANPWRVLVTSKETPLVPHAELPVLSVTFKDELNKTGSASVKFDTTDPLISYETVALGRTIVWIAHEGMPVWVGVPWTLRDGTLGCQGLLSVADRRLIVSDETYAAVDQGLILADLLTVLAPLGVTVPSPAASVIRDRTYDSTKLPTYGEALRELCSVSDGLGLAFIPRLTAGELSIEATIRYPRLRPTDTVLSLERNLVDLDIASDASRLASLVVASTRAGQADELFAWADDDGPYFALDRKVDGGSIVDQATLSQVADAALRDSFHPVLSVSATTRISGYPGLSLAVGDVVRVRDAHDLLTVDGDYAVVSRDVSPADDLIKLELVDVSLVDN